MKKDIHPKYYPNAKVKCACGATFETGSTEPEIQVEICSNCHPFYTNTQKFIDTAGRLDRFKERMAKSAKMKKPAPKKEAKPKEKESKKEETKK